MKTKIMILAVLLFSSVLFAQTKAIKVLLDDGSEIHYPVSEITKLTFVEDVCDGVTKLTYSGYVYHTIQIGNQCWLKENLNLGTMVQSDGSHTGKQQNNNGTIEKYCSNNDVTNCNRYGGLYEWEEAMQYVTTESAQGICPSGWHIPTNLELQDLKTHVSSQTTKIVDENAKNGYTYTNVTDFSAIFAGYRIDSDGSFSTLDQTAGFWSSTESGFGSKGDAIFLGFNTSNISINGYPKYRGYSVRCLKN